MLRSGKTDRNVRLLGQGGKSPWRLLFLLFHGSLAPGRSSSSFRFYGGLVLAADDTQRNFQPQDTYGPHFNSIDTPQTFTKNTCDGHCRPRQDDQAWVPATERLAVLWKRQKYSHLHYNECVIVYFFLLKKTMKICCKQSNIQNIFKN